MKRIPLLLIAFALLPLPVTAAEKVTRDIPYAEPKNERQLLDVYRLRTPRTCPSFSGFMAAAGRWATKPACKANRRPSWTKDSSSFPRTTDSCPALTWESWCATSQNPFAGYTITLPSTAAIRTACSSWVIPRCAARRADLHGRTLPEGRGAVAGHPQGLRARGWRHLRRAADHRDGRRAARPLASRTRSSAITRNSAATRKSTAISRPSITSAATRAFRPFCCCTSPTMPTPRLKPNAWARC